MVLREVWGELGLLGWLVLVLVLVLMGVSFRGLLLESLIKDDH